MTSNPKRIVVLVAIALSMAACNSAPTSSKPSTPGVSATTAAALPEVTFSKCTTSSNQFEGPVATVSVTNRTSKTSNYFITVAFNSTDGATQLDTAIAVVNNLAPGQTASADALSFKSNITSKFVCHLAKVTRLAS